MQGKILKGIGGFYYVHDGSGTVVECRAKGGFRRDEVKPLVGDNVTVSLTDTDPVTGRIDAIAERKNTLIRPAVANVDQAMIIVSVRHPAFHPGLLDRFLLWMEWQAVPVLVGIGKMDLAKGSEAEEIRSVYEGAGCRVCSFSAKTGEGIEELRQLLQGKTTVLAGASGVGKSTLLNRFVPEAEMETGTLSRKLSRGRHTTRHSEIFCFGPDSFLCDTPGFTALELPPLEAEELKGYFAEFAPYEGCCAFRDCLHDKETDCAVKTALAEGKIAPSRYESYGKFLEECRQRKKY